MEVRNKVRCSSGPRECRDRRGNPPGSVVLVLVTAGCVLGACVSESVDGGTWDWAPSAARGVCAAYLRFQNPGGEVAWVLADPTEDVRGIWCAGEVRAESANCVRWELTGIDEGERLGAAVVVVRDMDGDGWDEIAVGAPGAEGSGMYERGCVRLVSGRTGTEIWRADGRTAFDQMGTCVGRVSDWNGDGVEDVLACAPGEDHVRTLWGGCVVVLSGKTGERLWQADIVEGRQGPGRSVCAVDDLDGDGREEIVVGVPSSRGVGSVQVLGSQTGTMVWRVDGTVEEGGFGREVARTRDFNGDGVRDILITAPTEGVGGVLHLLSGADGSELRTLCGNVGEHLGTALFEVPDLDGDGTPEIGVRYDGADEWRVRVFSGGNLDVIGEYALARLLGVHSVSRSRVRVGDSTAPR